MLQSSRMATLLLGLVFLACAGAAADRATLPQILEELTAASFSRKTVVVRQLAETGDPRALPILQALLDGRLYYRKRDRTVVILVPEGETWWLADAASGDDLGTADKRSLVKIAINNRIRSALREAIARLSLKNPDSKVRLAAVEAMYDRLSPADAEQLRSLLTAEADPEVKRALRIGLALATLAEEGDAERLQAIEVLAHTTSRLTRDRLLILQTQAQSPKVRAAAHEAAAAIDLRLKFYSGLQTVFFGLSSGSVLLLAAIGLAITFGVMGVINMAHGEMLMVGAYTTYLIQRLMSGQPDFSLVVAIPSAFVIAGLMGVAIEQGVIRHLYGRPLETLLATFGVSLVLQQLARTAISAQNVTVTNPSWMRGALEVNEALSLTYNRIAILSLAVLVFCALVLLLRFTSFGLKVRAVAQNREMARALGVRVGFVDTATFGLGSGIAGVAGVALSQITNIGPNLGQSYIVDSFMVVVFGGAGNLWGTLVGALGLGIVNQLLEPMAGAMLAKILILVFIILFIQKYPRGLFPQRGRAVEG